MYGLGGGGVTIFLRKMGGTIKIFALEGSTSRQGMWTVVADLCKTRIVPHVRQIGCLGSTFGVLGCIGCLFANFTRISRPRNLGIFANPNLPRHTCCKSRATGDA